MTDKTEHVSNQSPMASLVHEHVATQQSSKLNHAASNNPKKSMPLNCHQLVSELFTTGNWKGAKIMFNLLM